MTIISWPLLKSIQSQCLQSAEIDSLKYQWRDTPGGVQTRVVSGCNQRVPQGNQIAGNIHLGYRLRQFSILNQETFDAIREISGRTVVVTTIKARNEDTFFHSGNQSIQILISVSMTKIDEPLIVGSTPIFLAL